MSGLPADVERAVHSLCERVLRAVERSAPYQRGSPWPRPLSIRWASLLEAPRDGHVVSWERTLQRAARSGQQAKWWTLTLGRPPFDDEITTLRVSEADWLRLEEAARARGIIPFRDTMTILRSRWESRPSLPPDAMPEWWARYELDMAARLQTPVPIGLGVTAERFSEEMDDVLDALLGARALAAGAAGEVGGYERIVSERVFGRSKRLASLRGRIASHLRAADPQWADSGATPDQVLAAYGVRRLPPTILVGGPLDLSFGRSRLVLADAEGMVAVPAGWAQAFSSEAASRTVRCVTTVENETAAVAYVEARGGTAGLVRDGEVVVYTGGYGSGPVADALRALAALRPAIAWRHWGDADPWGVDIWVQLRRRTGAPLTWWGTTADWVEQQAARGAGSPLTPRDRSALRRVQELLDAWEVADATSTGVIAPARACLAAITATGRRIEQEAEDQFAWAISRDGTGES